MIWAHRYMGGVRPLIPFTVVPRKDWVPAFAGMSGKGGVSLHRQAAHHRSFNVESPTRASMAATIQKRMTTVDSGQPIFSK